METMHQHPRSLYLLFFIELWERFSFYGLQAILVLYLFHHFGLTENHATEVYGTYIALGFTLPILGGYLADKILGHTRAIMLGSVFIIVGNIILTIPDTHALYFGLGFLITGTGLFKPNVSSLLGTLYYENDPRRNSGFTIFYMGINFGSMAPLIYGYISVRYGYPQAFLAGAIGMAIGHAIFLLLKHRLQRDMINQHKIDSPSNVKIAITCLGITGSVWLVAELIAHTAMIGNMLWSIGLILLGIQVYIAYREGPRAARRIMALILLTLFGICFYTIILQLGSSFTLFADRNIERVVMGFKIPSASFSALEPIFVVLLAPLIALLWLRLGVKKREPSYGTKFAIGLLMASLSVLMLAIAAGFAMRTGHCSPLWLVGMYLLQALGDVTLSPTGLSAVTTLAPPRNLVGFFMGIWFVGIAVAGFLAGKMNELFQPTTAATMAELTPIQQAAVYQHGFQQMFIMSLITTVCAFVLIPVIKRLINWTPRKEA